MNQNVIEILIQAKNQATAVLKSAASELAAVASAAAVSAAVITASMGASAAAAVRYEEVMTNTAAVLQITRQEQQALSSELLQVSQDTRFGATQIATAYYDIASGVADASSHMAILQAASATAEAGNAALTGTTSALISVMNSYKFSAEQAGYASDVMTQIVAKGVGTMDQFATALPTVTGLARSMGVSFADLGAQMAYLTTQGFTASTAAQRLQAMMTALMNPNTQMIPLLQRVGFASGEAAVKQLGLAGAYQVLQQAAQQSNANFAAAVGSVEAYSGALALAGTAAKTALDTFKVGLDQATESARAIQMQSTAAQLDLLRSSIEAIRIAIGEALLPMLVNFVEFVRPIIMSTTTWIQQNQPLVQTILSVVGALVGLVPVLYGVSQAISLVGAVTTALAGPWGLAIKLASLIAVAFATNFGGIRDLFVRDLFPVLAAFGELFGALFKALQPLLSALADLFASTIGAIFDLLRPFIDVLVQVIRMVTGLVKLLTGDLAGGMKAFAATLPQNPVQAQQQLAQQYAQGLKNQAQQNLSGAVQIPDFSSALTVNLPTSSDLSAFNTNLTSTVSTAMAGFKSGGVTYSNPMAAYAADLAKLGLNPTVKNGQFVVNMPAVQQVALTSSAATLSVTDASATAAIRDLTTSIQTLKAVPAVNVTSTAPTVSVAAPVVNLPTPTAHISLASVVPNVTVMPPLVSLPAQPAPVVNVASTVPQISVAPPNVRVAAPAAPNVTITTPTPNLSVLAPSVNIPPQPTPIIRMASVVPTINLASPAINLPQVPVPTVNLTTPAPVVRVNPPLVSLPAQPAPLVNVTSNLPTVNVASTPIIVPTQPAPVINVASTVPQMIVRAPVVNLPQLATPTVNFAATAPVVNLPAPVVNLPTPTTPIVNVAARVPNVSVAAPVVNLPEPSLPQISIPSPQVQVNMPVTPAEADTRGRADDMTRLLDRIVLGNSPASPAPTQTNHYTITVQMPVAALDNPKAAQQAGQDFGTALVRELVRQGV